MVIFYVLLAIESMVLTVAYTGDLEMGWFAVWLFVPIWALIVGLIAAGAARWTIRATTPALAWLILFSIGIHSALMLEESFAGSVRNEYAAWAQEANAAERAKRYHKVGLDQGHAIYFTGEPDETRFRLDFKYRGRRDITKEEIFDVARSWLRAKNYEREDLSIVTQLPIYRKDGFFVRRTPGRVMVRADLKNGPTGDSGRLASVYLDLSLDDDRFDLAQTAAAYR